MTEHEYKFCMTYVRIHSEQKIISTIRTHGDAIGQDITSDYLGIKVDLFKIFTRFGLMPAYSVAVCNFITLKSTKNLVRVETIFKHPVLK